MITDCCDESGALHDANHSIGKLLIALDAAAEI